MNRARLVADLAFAATGAAALYFAYQYDKLSSHTLRASQRQAIWDGAKSNMMKEIDAALGFHTRGMEVDVTIKLRAAILRNRVYEAWSTKNEDLRSQVEQEIQEFGKNGC